MGKIEITPALFDRHEAAAFLNISLRQLEMRSASGEVPGFCKPFGTTARWSRSALQTWIDGGCQPVQQIPQLSAIHETDLAWTSTDNSIGPV